MKELITCNKESIIFNKKNKAVEFSGIWGSVNKRFGGNDLHYFEKKVFVKTKKSFQNFKNSLVTIAGTANRGYFIELALVGLGFRFLKTANYFLLKIGYGHYIKYNIPPSLHVVGYKRKLYIFGVTEGSVKDFATKVRLQRSPDSYKGKGIVYSGENVELKVGKQK